MTVWTLERIEEVRVLWEAGKSASQIATAIGGITKNAVIGIAFRRGWTKHGTAARQANVAVRNARQAERMRRYRERRQTTFNRPPGETRPGADGALGMRVAHALKHPPKVFMVPPAEPSGVRACGLMALQAHSCRWPVGEATGVSQMYCGAVKEGWPDAQHAYCPWHRDRARGTGTPSERTAVREAERAA